MLDCALRVALSFTAVSNGYCFVNQNRSIELYSDQECASLIWRHNCGPMMTVMGKERKAGNSVSTRRA